VATVSNVDTRIFGCLRAQSVQDCNSSESNFLDSNHPVYTPGFADYVLSRVADGAGCAAIRAALP
jgi:phage major head subunit gpT-like protein